MCIQIACVCALINHFSYFRGVEHLFSMRFVGNRVYKIFRKCQPFSCFGFYFLFVLKHPFSLFLTSLINSSLNAMHSWVYFGVFFFFCSLCIFFSHSKNGIVCINGKSMLFVEFLNLKLPDIWCAPNFLRQPARSVSAWYIYK